MRHVSRMSTSQPKVIVFAIIACFPLIFCSPIKAATSGGYCYVNISLSPDPLPAGWSWVLSFRGPTDSIYWRDISGTSSTGYSAGPKSTWQNQNVDWLLEIKNGSTVYKEFYKSCPAGTLQVDFNVVLTPDPPFNISASQNQPDKITLSWASNTLAQSFNIYRSTSPTWGTETLIASGITNRNYTDTNLTTNKTYYYWIVAVNSAGTSYSSTFLRGPTAGATSKLNQTINIVPIPDQELKSSVFISATATSKLPVTLAVVLGPAIINNNTLSFTGVGEVVISANQSGNDVYNPAQEVRASFTVGKNKQEIAQFAPIADTPYSSGSIPLIAPAASSGLPVVVSIKEGPGLLLDNRIIFTARGRITLAANQVGDAAYSPADEVTVSFNVGDSQFIEPFAAIADCVYGASPFLIAVPSASSGLPVTIVVKSGPAILSGNQLSVTGAGVVELAATQGGNNFFLPAAEVTTTFTVLKAPQRIAVFAPLDALEFSGSPYTIPILSSDSGLSVSLSVKSGAADIIDGQLVAYEVGDIVLAANQEGDNNYLAAQEVQTLLTVKKGSQIITFPEISPQFVGKSRQLAAISTSGLPITYSVVSGPAEIFGNSLTVKGTGPIIVSADQQGNMNYHPAPTVTTGFIGINSATAVVWGNNSYNQSTIPIGVTDVVSISSGYWDIAIVRSSGDIVLWGYNRNGKLTVPSGLTGVKAVAGGFNFTLALLQDGTLRAWGDNPNIVNNISNLKDVAEIDATGTHMTALRKDGTVTALGYQSVGTIFPPSGLSNIISTATGANHTLALKRDGTVVGWGGYNDWFASVTPTDLSNIIQIASGDDHGVALNGDGLVRAWGGNAAGQTNIPSGLTDVVGIAAGGNHSLALKSDGTVTAWGSNDYGQCNVPANLSGVVDIAAGSVNSAALVAAKADQQIQVPNDNAATFRVGQSLVLNAASTSGLPITYSVTEGPGVVDKGVLQFTGVGNVLVKALQGGSSSFNPAPEVTLTFTVSGVTPSPLSSWKELHFGPSSGAADGDSGFDYDGDGLVNLLEYALGGNPKRQDSADIEPIIVKSASNLQLSFVCSDTKSDISYIVQATSNMLEGAWTDIAYSSAGSRMQPVNGRSTVLDSGVGEREVTVTDHESSLSSKRFLRLKVVVE